jgi:hypothetical protein
MDGSCLVRNSGKILVNLGFWNATYGRLLLYQ